MSVETSIVVPTLDHAVTLGPTLERLNRVVAASGAAAEVLVVDAGSRDGTLEVAAEFADRYPLLHVRLLVQERGAADSARCCGSGWRMRPGASWSS